jgi:hypothetical protein
LITGHQGKGKIEQVDAIKKQPSTLAVGLFVAEPTVYLERIEKLETTTKTSER